MHGALRSRQAPSAAPPATRADVVLDDERSNADAVLAHERAERRRQSAESLAVERDATDKDLTGERAHATR